MHLRATRSISEDEEITLSYCDEMESTEERQGELDSYGFVCTCRVCVDADVSDLRRALIRDTLPPAPMELEKWALNPTLPDNHLLSPMLSLLKMMEAEGLEGHERYCECLLSIMGLYSLLGDEVNVVKYGKKASVLLMALNGNAINFSNLDMHSQSSQWGLRKSSGKER